MATNTPSAASARSPDARAQIKTIAVYGAGIMGAGIAQISAQAGYTVHLWDMSDAELAKGLDEIQSSLARIAHKHKHAPTWVPQIMSRIHTTTDKLAPVAASADADLVIEAIIEDLATKQELFAQLDAAAKPTCIFATNTSSLLVSHIAAKVSAARRTRFVALHFFNPVAIMKLVEIAHLDALTLPGLVETLRAWCADVGKVAVVCRDTPGFIVNRLLVPYNSEARALVERGDATVEDVDVAMRLGAGYPMGPFELQDMTGLDTGYRIVKGWYESAPGLKGDPRFKPSPWIEDMIEKGHLGRKAGRGFYTYKAKL